MKLIFILLIVVSSLLQIKSLIWSRTSNTPAIQCCGKDSPSDCCCIHHSGVLVRFKQAGIIIPIERLRCQHFNNCTTDGFACNSLPTTKLQQ